MDFLAILTEISEGNPTLKTIIETDSFRNQLQNQLAKAKKKQVDRVLEKSVNPLLNWLDVDPGPVEDVAELVTKTCRLIGPRHPKTAAVTTFIHVASALDHCCNDEDAWADEIGGLRSGAVTGAVTGTASES